MNPRNAPGNYHTHCHLCDGVGKPVEYARFAASHGFSALGFSSHAPLGPEVEWTMRRENLPLYAAEVEEAKAAVADTMPVFTGLEIDFIPGVIGPDSALFPELALDFTIGSVHFVGNGKGEQFAVDAPLDEFTETVEKGFNGDIVGLVGTYFANMREMLRRFSPDFLGHFDVIRKNNGEKRFFDPGESWYRREVMATIEAVTANGCIVEVNTGALARGHDALYPERWIAEELHARNVRMMVNSDAHAPEHIGFKYERAFALLRETGFREHWLLTDEGWKAVPL